MRRGGRAGVAGAVLVAGWVAHAFVCKETVPVAAAAPVGAPSDACVDPAAMEANANLVRDLREARARLARAEDHEREVTAKLGRAEVALPRQLDPSREEWTRMARQRTIALKTPCADWESAPHWRLRRQNGGRARYGGSSSDVRARAELAGLSEEETATLAEVYRRANERTWSLIRATCEGNDDFKNALVEMTAPDEEGKRSEVSINMQIGLCQGTLLSPTDDVARGAIRRVAELRAAGAKAERASGDRERVMFALTESPAMLHEEMVRAIGREKAALAVDHGAICLDETVYDLRDAS